MNLSSAILLTHPSELESLRTALTALPGVEVHATSPQGKLIITLETTGDADTMDMFEAISKMNEVLSATMVYHQTESDPDKELSYDTDAA